MDLETAAAVEIASHCPGETADLERGTLVEVSARAAVILDPQASRLRTDAERLARSQDFRDDDIVLGEFLGDQELLVIAPSESGMRRVLIALPLDPRSNWPGAGADLATFLVDYFEAGGNKYWERGPT